MVHLVFFYQVLIHNKTSLDVESQAGPCSCAHSAHQKRNLKNAAKSIFYYQMLSYLVIPADSRLCLLNAKVIDYFMLLHTWVWKQGQIFLGNTVNIKVKRIYMYAVLYIVCL